jgi:hypothetical protein
MSKKPRIRNVAPGLIERGTNEREDAIWGLREQETMLDFIIQHGYSDQTFYNLKSLLRRSEKAIYRQWERFLYTEKSTRIFDYKPSSSRKHRKGKLTCVDKKIIEAHRGAPKHKQVPLGRTAAILNRSLGELREQMRNEGMLLATDLHELGVRPMHQQTTRPPSHQSGFKGGCRDQIVGEFECGCLLYRKRLFELLLDFFIAHASNTEIGKFLDAADSY